MLTLPRNGEQAAIASFKPGHFRIKIVVRDMRRKVIRIENRAIESNKNRMPESLKSLLSDDRKIGLALLIFLRCLWPM